MIKRVVKYQTVRFYRRRLYDIYNFLARKKGSPELSQDVHRLAGKCDARWRIELVGVSGIGKSFIAEKLAEQLGTPIQWPKRVALSISDPIADAARGDLFEEAVSNRLLRNRTSQKSFKKMKRLAGVFEADRTWDGNPNGSPVVFASGLIQWVRGELLGAAEKNQNNFESFMSERLVIFCTSDNPGLRGARGRIARGSSEESVLTSEKVRARGHADLGIQRFARVLEAHGIPVLRLNLDEPENKNVALVATFLRQNGITSPRISHRARQRSSTNPTREG